MQFSLLQENLHTALSHVSRFTSGRSQLPILGNILFSTDSGRLRLSATNLELGINYWVGAKVETEGQFTIPTKEISEFVSYLSPGKLDFSLNDQLLLSLSSSQVESTFATQPAADFPQLPSFDPGKSFQLDLSLLSQSVSQITFAAATDDSRPVLTAVYWCFTPTNFILAATDGFRLSFKSHPLPSGFVAPDQPIVFLIPNRTLSEVTKLAKNAKTVKVGLTPDEHQVVFVLDDLELVSRLIEGDYPDFQKIIPESTSTKLVLDRSELTQSIKIASVFARESANVVKFILHSSQLEITANAPQVGSNKVKLDAKVEGEPLEIAFNYKFVADFLNVAKGETVTIDLNQPLTPAIFRDSADPDFQHIIMPVRIQD
jgi:DNA polymerase-3 subunit beta